MHIIQPLVIVLLCVVVGFLAIQVESQRRDNKATRRFVENKNARSVSLAKITEIETTLTELLDSYQALMTSHKKLRSRIGMRENRAKTNGAQPDGVPDPAVDPAGYKKAMRLQLARRNLK